ncbi:MULTISPECIES: DUF1127 domain-containing protein [unclassified Mesorhizobium]|uniref:DUF1127 domain-containing protein n=1 Tax=unclassified Mesorhizobium TaxID=325217 RepID=UPI000FD6EF80|nr:MULTISPECIES: DUF1127 domain-containing protein [unclassified Mesorhizobium]TGQ34943.1 DUF1127 domain-containing protein [Mesorhizobium sp. M00.F.Ca.ET.216.01.1.1]TIS60002.1 MAG: DUF1127 domain-containing protein [Mesorhizobium sp.]TIS89599.1 MAG: DUF1127 domain-containing protein [Mesorhizobium sp.]TJW10549.1 MAG: DUF1127 domain-containing protein [Mesorhizobium sp.]TJW39476.1 MAG: DUF1127 domain-containing protein [Mesorhizobium sp.]
MTARTAPSAALANRLPFPFVSLRRFRLRLLARWYDRHLQRLDLAEIDDHLLRDLGLTPQDVRRECAKSFWQI